DTQFIPMHSSSRALEALNQGRVDYALSYTPNIEKAQKKGFPIHKGYVLVHQPLELFISHYPVSKLKGKKIAHQASPGSISETILKQILAQAHLTLDDVEIIYSFYNLAAGLLSRQFDGAMNIPRTYAADILKHNPHLYAYELSEFGIHFEGQVLVHHQDNTQSHSLYQGIDDAKKEILEAPSKSWSVITKAYPELNTEKGRTAWLCYCDLLKAE
ncbi:MAG: ABC transporter substrate-binding protein, partial [Alphaproteobacteria bacterium]|nr:ABC transporter substrate-binding protein [Alphaproteobacteria bacterium]